MGVVLMMEQIRRDRVRKYFMKDTKVMNNIHKEFVSHALKVHKAYALGLSIAKTSCDDA